MVKGIWTVMKLKALAFESESFLDYSEGVYCNTKIAPKEPRIQFADTGARGEVGMRTVYVDGKEVISIPQADAMNPHMQTIVDALNG